MSPVTNAFCNCPLRPVFQGPMVVTPCFRHLKSKPATKMIKTPTIGMIRKYIHVFPEVPLVGDCSLNGFSAEWVEALAPIVGGLAGESNGTGDWGWCFFAFGIAGKAPLLRVVGRAIIGWEEDPPPAGAAWRLLDCSSSLRRTKLARISTFCSGDPAQCKRYQICPTSTNFENKQPRLENVLYSLSGLTKQFSLRPCRASFPSLNLLMRVGNQ